MKRIIPIIVALATLSCSNAQKTKFNETAYTNKLINLDNTQISFKEILQKHKGKILIIEIWASWCGDCIKAMPLIKELQENNKDIDYVFISMDKTIDKWREGIDKHQLNGDHYMAADGMKGSFGKSIDVDWIPRYIIINKNGDVVLYKAIETDFEKIKTTLNILKNAN